MPKENLARDDEPGSDDAPPPATPFCRASRATDGRGLLEEDLKSPCTGEVAVFHVFAKLVAESRRQFVVLDAAPTRHRALARRCGRLPPRGAEVLRTAAPGTGDKLVTPLMRLRDADQTKVLIVTLPETTPVDEAARLQADLRRAEIEPFAWIVRASPRPSGPTSSA